MAQYVGKTYTSPTAKVIVDPLNQQLAANVFVGSPAPNPQWLCVGIVDWSASGVVPVQTASEGPLGGSCPTDGLQLGWCNGGVFTAVSPTEPLPVTGGGSPDVTIVNPVISYGSPAENAVAVWVVNAQSACVTQCTSPWIVSDSASEASLASIASTVSHYGSPASPVVQVEVMNQTSGTLTVLQGTSPWIVSGAVTVSGTVAFSNTTIAVTNTGTFAAQVTGTVAVSNFPASQVVTLASTTITGTVAVSGTVGLTGATFTITGSPAVSSLNTYIEGGTVCVTQCTSPWLDNVIQVAGVTLGATAVVHFGTAPAAVNVEAVNASIFAGATGITATGSSMNVNVTGGSGATVAGTLTNNNAAPGAASLLGVLGAIAETAYTTVTYTTGDMVLPVTDLHGALNSDLQAVAGVQLGATAIVNYGSTPAAVAVPGVNAWVTNPSAIFSPLINASPAALAVGVGGQFLTTLPTLTNTQESVLMLDASGQQLVDMNSVATVLLGPTAIVHYGSTPAAVNVPAVNAFITNASSVGTVGNLTNNNAAPTTTNLGVLAFIAETSYATATYVTGNQVLAVTDLHGAVNSDLQAYAGSAAVTNGIAGNIPVGNYKTNVTADATWTSATALNTAFTTVSNIVGYSTVAITVNSTPTGTLTAGALTFEISNDNTIWTPIAGVDPNTLATVGPTYTLLLATNTTFLFTVPLPYFRVRLSTAITGSGTVIVGHAVGTLPQVHNITGTISGSLGATYNTSAPTPAAAATVPLQTDYVGDLITRPFRRSQTIAQATTITASAAKTTVLAAQAAGIFADLSLLIISVVPGATVDTAFTAILTDGTANYTFSLDTGALATATGVPPPLVIPFDPPLPATTAATVWSITLSSATPTAYINIVAVLEKAF
jgi:hypothetical protein